MIIFIAGGIVGFIVGFAIAAEIGRTIYNRKMEEITEMAQKALNHAYELPKYNAIYRKDQ